MKADKISELRNKIALAKSEQVISELNKYLSQQSENYNSFLLVSAEYHALQKDISDNLISEEQKGLKRSRINSSLINLLNKIEENDLFDSPLHKIPIIHSILLVVSNENRIKELGAFFKNRNFTNVSIETRTEFNKTDNQFLIIFDNRDVNREDLMQKYIENNSNSYYIFLGQGRSTVVFKNPERVYAANSTIALYSRIKEFIDYIQIIDIEK